MAVWDVIVESAFPDNKGIKIGNPNCIIADTPNGNETAPQGTLCWDSTNSNVWVNTDGSTTWVQLS